MGCEVGYFGEFFLDFRLFLFIFISKVKVKGTDFMLTIEEVVFVLKFGDETG